ncbi:hypothetical protein B0O99DRAFT_689249 [Bisporella sp. PMI_857]|nr:hypothetical protein B0O99DRAFT_689249 [Bisporella sp. PMI_857]
MIPKVIKKVLLSKKVPLIVTILLAPIAFALSIVAISSRGDNGLDQHYVVKLNTSTLLQSVLKVVPVNSSSVTARAIEPMITAPPVLDERQLFPNLEEANSWFQSVASGISSAIVSPPSGTSGGLGGALGNVSLPDIFTTDPIGAFLNNLAGQAAAGIVSLVNNVVSSAVDQLGIADQYSIFMLQLCSANLTTGTQKLGPQRCSALRDISISPSSSNFQVGDVLVDFSALNIPNKLSGAGGTIKALFDAIFALQIIGIVSTGLLFLTSLFLIFPFFQRSLIRGVAWLLAILGSLSLTIVTIIEAIIAIIIPVVVNNIGDGLGVEADSGGSFLALVIVSSAFVVNIAALWTLHLIVSWHELSYVRREQEVVIGKREKPIKPVRLN